jgi:Leucine-rich repeat (LRR) protein
MATPSQADAEYLSLAARNLQEIDARLLERLSGMRRLSTLDLRTNDIAYLPQTLGKLKALEHLDLRGNPVMSACFHPRPPCRATIASHDPPQETPARWQCPCQPCRRCGRWR